MCLVGNLAYRESCFGRLRGSIHFAGNPLLLSVRITYSQYRRAMEYVKILYRADRYQYFAKLTR